MTRANPSVVLRAQGIWRIRLSRELPRYLAVAVALAGLTASARFAIAPPRAVVPAAALAREPGADRAAEGFAVLFARRYLSWNAAAPQGSARQLERFLDPGLPSGLGLVLPAAGEQNVEWAEVVQAREPAPGGHVYTVAAQTDTDGLQYLTVGVQRTTGGALALAGYPAFVGAPASGGRVASVHLQEVSDPTLATVVERALRNYLGASPGELQADLSSGARVSLPSQALALESVASLSWTAKGSVLAVLQAQDARGVQFTLAYELDVVRLQGRWEVSAVQMDPNAQ